MIVAPRSNCSMSFSVRCMRVVKTHVSFYSFVDLKKIYLVFLSFIFI